MDAAKGVKGQGQPLYAAPRNNDGVNEPCRRQGRMPGLDLLVPFGAIAKRDSPVRGETKIRNHHANELVAAPEQKASKARG